MMVFVVPSSPLPPFCQSLSCCCYTPRAYTHKREKQKYFIKTKKKSNTLLSFLFPCFLSKLLFPFFDFILSSSFFFVNIWLAVPAAIAPVYLYIAIHLSFHPPIYLYWLIDRYTCLSPDTQLKTSAVVVSSSCRASTTPRMRKGKRKRHAKGQCIYLSICHSIVSGWNYHLNVRRICRCHAEKLKQKEEHERKKREQPQRVLSSFFFFNFSYHHPLMRYTFRWLSCPVELQRGGDSSKSCAHGTKKATVFIILSSHPP